MSEAVGQGEGVERSAAASVLAAVRLALWHALAFLLVLLLPVQYRLGQPVWTAPPDVMLQALLGGAGYLLAALLAAAYRARGPVLRVLIAWIAAGCAFVALAAIPIVLPQVPLSRALLGIAGIMSIVLLTLRALPSGPPGISLALLVIPLAGTLYLGRQRTASEDFSVDTASYLLRVTVHRAPVLAEEMLVEGGGLTPVGDEMLLATGVGRFARIRPAADGSVAIEPLEVTSPDNRADFARDVGTVAPVNGFRIADVLAEPAGDSVVVHLSHHYWRAADRCFVLRVSVATAHDDLRRWSPWRTLFDAEPCLPIREGERGISFAGPGAGGRMMRLPEGLLLTVGDHLFDGLNSSFSVSQDSASHYGKMLLLQEDGSARIVAMGNRNPQGLGRDPAGHIWITEHGPRGGDELDLFDFGVNFGWPVRTLGTEYEMRRWPLIVQASEQFREPSYAFIPSVGISNLISPSGRMFADWSGDLLIASLRARELMRVRLDGVHPVYVERIPIGFEMRDLEEAPDGSLIVWTDHGALLRISVDEDDSSGSSLVATCQSCHTLADQPGGMGPTLFRIVGRRVASVPGFPYSEALRAVGGRWTPERLDEFLTNPAAFAPGTTMAFSGIQNPEQRRILIDYLRSPALRMPGGGAAVGGH